MNKLILYGGQGNVRLTDLVRLTKDDDGKNLLKQLESFDSEMYGYFQKVLKGTVPFSDNYASMLSTFLYNAWRTSEVDLNEILYFSSHSAGIFNVLLSSGSVEFGDVLRFIQRRADLVKLHQGDEEMWLVVTQSLSLLENLIQEKKEVIKLAIKTNATTGVAAFSERNKLEIENFLKSQGLLVKFKKLSLRIPYHTAFLDDIAKEYNSLVDELFIKQNNQFRYIYSSKNLENEIKNQLTQNFNWQGVLEQIVDENLEVYDFSPNKFMKKQLKMLSENVKFGN
ncbi:hypothetical protein [Lactococcus allomyrinae]|uniref:[acyl-carrier-protein] S-malonyltransferase n=1 Tax=Lactococcus allomyrinae TaxID=2419773 RepID=A0A387BHC8_9LACT|nr:hypothetical protein [Lactococcus allomyrinae]AYG02058.1 hypothetical protein D7I46_13045 [Lactococcus allomyrinae]